MIFKNTIKVACPIVAKFAELKEKLIYNVMYMGSGTEVGALFNGNCKKYFWLVLASSG